MSNAMASHIGDNPQEQNSTNEKAKDTMIEDMEGARHLQDLANCEPLRILSEKLKNVKQLSSEACIFKVHEMLHKTKPEAYTPLTISIGPYHHGKPEFRKMERLKELYTQSFMGRLELELYTHVQSLSEGVGVEELYTESLLNRAGAGVEECWKKLKELEGRAKRYYGDEIEEKVSGDKFVKMLLLDGCFIVEYVFRSYLGMKGKGQQYGNDPIYMQNIVRDMLLLENQLPFFVLQALYDMISNPGNPEFLEMVKFVFRSKINTITLPNTKVKPQEIKHLLQIVHILCQPQPQLQNNRQIQQKKAKAKACSSSCYFWKQPQDQGQGGSDIESNSLSNGQDRRQFFRCFLSKFWGRGVIMQFSSQSKDEDKELLYSIRTASELHEAGVHFKKVGNIIGTSSDQTISLFDIKFNHGVLEIPSFALYDTTETLFRNLIAYEQHLPPDVHPIYFTDYAVFMDDLINTEKNVNLLRLKNVFINKLGDDKEVTCLFNNLNKEVWSFHDDFYYRDVCKELNRHCKKPWNVLMAKLRRDYFHTPWAGISTFAAILLLSLAIAQTVLSALQLHN
ncbi:uncharacterized protein LOC116007451 [Ipomoea triloba]|uniref:uncharacterized protein LOC116007451 n=1 Tax=Ipomoea triloba TaxID=35885 RepID=UPI00125CE72D|nr:uncharacterized protein LOC116007451 [Ipomoea triloba]